MILKLGPQERPFLGLLSMPPERPVRRAWLLLRPFGQVAIRSAPLYRVLAERLAQSGEAALRFDYHGCGDSPGEFEDRGLEHLVDDAIEAFETLRLMAPAASYAWFGISIGANVAAMAAAEAPVPPQRLLLWEPVLDGPGYCERLLATHRQEMAEELVAEWTELTQQRGLDEPSIPGSVLGVEFGVRLSSQLMTLRSLPLAAVLKRGIEVDVATDAQHHGLLPAANPRLRAQEPGIKVNWMTGAAESVAVAPQPIVRFVTDAR